MSRAASRGLRAWVALACVAALCVGCAARPAATPGATPGDDLEAPKIDSPPPEDPTQKSELEALDLDLVQANKYLEDQLRRKRSETYRAESDGEKGDADRAGDERKAGQRKTPRKKHSTGAGRGGGTAEKPATEPVSPELDEEEGARDQTIGVRGSPCDLACRALHSMERSAERICALAGDGSERCKKAKRMVQRASDRVREAGCQCTAGDKQLMSALAPRGAVCNR